MVLVAGAAELVGSVKVTPGLVPGALVEYVSYSLFKMVT